MAKKFKYSMHPGIVRMQKAVAGMKVKTGRSRDEWMSYAKQRGPADAKARRAWLLTQGLSASDASWISEQVAGGDEDMSPEHYLDAAGRYVEQMYGGAKAGLRPMFDALMALGLGLGRDVTASPCKTMVPLYRKHVFAQIKPSTRTRIDFGLYLPGEKATARLIDTGGEAKRDRITHRLEITSLEDIDATVARFAKKAYEKAAPKG